MRALTVCQPFAHLIALGRKRVENRTWFTNYRSPIAIHAGKSRAWLDSYPERFDGMAFGAIVALCNLVSCVPMNEDRHVTDPNYQWLKTDEHAFGPWCWVLDDVYRFLTPFRCQGHQGLWHLEDTILAGQELMRVEVKGRADALG